MTQLDTLIRLNQRLDSDQARLRRLAAYASGDQPLAFLSAVDRDRLDSRLTALPVNVPRLVVRSIADRLAVSGFTRDGVPDAALWSLWRKNRMQRRAAGVLDDALTYGRAYLMVGASATGARISVESPFSTLAKHDPATGDVVAAVKRWVVEGDVPGQDAAYATLMLPDRIVRYKALGNNFSLDPGSVPTSAWQVIEEVRNPLGVVPCVPLVHAAHLDDVKGRSAFEDVTGLVDALVKVLLDSMIVSEAYARPRRWATGLQLPAGDDDEEYGEAFDPEADMLISEESETKFGAFPASDLAGQEALVRVLVGQISAVTSLPPFLVGLSTATPASAEALSVALDGLVGRVKSCQAAFGDAFAQAMAIAEAVDAGSSAGVIETAWANPEARSLGASADAAQKLIAAGVDPATVLDKTLGWSGVAVTKEAVNG